MKEDHSQQEEDQSSNLININNNNNRNNDNIDPNTNNGMMASKKESISNFHDLNLKFGHKLNLNYSDFDRQKGCLSPRFLFKKRKNDTDIASKPQNADVSIDKSILDNINPFILLDIRTANSLKCTFDTLLDFVQDTYFTQEAKDEGESLPESKASLNGPAFRFTSLDLLINPLRQKFIWELWSPYELALFHCCICKFGTNFEFYENIVRLYYLLRLFINAL